MLSQFIVHLRAGQLTNASQLLVLYDVPAQIILRGLASENNYGS